MFASKILSPYEIQHCQGIFELVELIQKCDKVALTTIEISKEIQEQKLQNPKLDDDQGPAEKKEELQRHLEKYQSKMQTLLEIGEILKKNLELIRASKGIKEEFHFSRLPSFKDLQSIEERKASNLKESGEEDKDSDAEEEVKVNEEQLMESVRRTVNQEEERKSNLVAYDQADISKIHVEMKDPKSEREQSQVVEDLRSWQDIEDSKEEEIKDLAMKPFNIEDFKEQNEALLTGKKFINISAVGILFDCFYKILAQIMSQLTVIRDRNKVHNRYTRRFVITYARLEMAEYMLYAAVEADPYSMFYQPVYNDDNQLLKQITCEVPVVNQARFQKQVEELGQNLQLGGALASKQGDESSPLVTFFKMVGFSSYYLVSKKKRQEQNDFFLSDTRQQDFFRYLDMSNGSLAKKTYRLILPNIHLKKIIYVPMLTKKITLEETESYINFKGPITRLKAKHFSAQERQYQLSLKNQYPDKYVRVRILSSHNLDVNFKTRQIQDPTPKVHMMPFCLCFKKSLGHQSEEHLVEKIIIHIHGGGFICQDSFMHQNYTRMWVNSLGIPVFSIDYRLAPKNPFPDAINDCYQAYYWILTEGIAQLGIFPKEILLVGDSAGGHLTLAVAMMAIVRGFKLPTQLMVHYPATCLDMQQFFPSFLLSLDDPVVNSTFLKFCILSFNKDERANKLNPFLSPLYASDYILKKLPPIRMFLCEVDPLRDQGLAFGLKLKKLGNDVKIYYMKDYLHGFNSMDMPRFGIEEMHNGSMKVMEVMRELFKIDACDKKKK